MPHNQIIRAEVHDLNGGIATGLKRQIFRSTFHGVDLFVGPNGAGKTTTGPLVLVAALEGLAEKPTDTRRPYLGGTLPRDTGLTVTVATPTGEQSWTRDLGATRGLAKTEADATARTLIGRLPTSWDLSDFASGTAGDRAKILDAAARAGGVIESWDAATAQARVRAHILPPPPDDGQQSAREPAEVALTEATLDTLDECIAALPTAATGADWLAAAKVWAEKVQTDRNSDQKDKAAYAKEQGGKVPAKVDGDDNADRAEQDALLTERATASHIEQARERARTAIARHEAEGVRLQKALDAALAEGQRLATPLPSLPADTRLAEMEQALSDAQAAVKAPIPAYDGPDPAALKTALDETKAAMRSAADRLTAATEAEERSAAAKRTAQDALSSMIAKQQDAAAAVTTIESELRTLRSLGGVNEPCRHCGGQDPHGVGARIAETETRLADAVASRDTANEDRSRVGTVAAKAEADWRTADQTKRQAERAYDAAESVHNAAGQRLTDAQRAATGHEASVRATRAATLARARADLERHVTDRAAAEKRHAADVAQRAQDTEAARDRYRAANRAMKEHTAADVPTIPDPPDAARLAEIAAALARIAIRTSARAVRAAAVESVRTALLDYEEAKLSWDASRAYVDAVKAATVQLAAVAYAPIEHAAQDLVAGADELPRPYFTDPDDYGAVIRGRRVPYHGLSESEQRITAACLVYALAVVSAQPCRLVLLDGLEVVQRGLRAPLLAAFVRAHEAGLVDNVVITMATSADPRIAAEETAEVDLPGLHLHRLTLPDLQPEHDEPASIDRPADAFPLSHDEEVPF